MDEKPPSRIQGVNKGAPVSSGNTGDMANKLAVPVVQWHLCRQRGRASWGAILFNLYTNRAS